MCTNQATSILGLDGLKYLYFEIWMKLISVDLEKRKELIADALVFDFDETLIAEHVKTSLLALIETFKTFLKDHSLIPNFIKPLWSNKLKQLIENAVKAKYNLHLNEDYIIDSVGPEENILPLEKDIGVRLQNFIWTDLHPFLQLKHNLCVNSCGSLTCVYIPNCLYLKMYKSIYGLTGTLGSLEEQNFINKMFNVECKIIPPFEEGKRRELPILICDGEAMWFDEITKSVLEVTQQGRAVLLICDTPKVVKQMHRKLISDTNTIIDADTGTSVERIVLYEHDGHAKRIEVVRDDGIRPGQIVIATNIAGRGTDIKLKPAVAKQGGLHVITTYLPRNERTEKQASGRAARSGQRGSCQIIMQKSEVLPLLEELKNKGEVLTPEKVMKWRKEKEADRLSNATTHLDRITSNYLYFKTFSKYYYYWKRHTNTNRYLLEDLKMRFGMFYEESRNPSSEFNQRSVKLRLIDVS
jgi:hypothetical protein